MKAIITIFGFLLFIQKADHAIGGIVNNTCSKVCRNGYKICGDNYYNPIISTCLDGKICENGEKICDDNCYMK